MALGLSAAIPSLAFGRDRMIVNGLDVSLLNGGFIDLLRKSGVNCVYTSAGGMFGFGSVSQFVDDNTNDVTLATSVKDIYRAKRQGKIAFILGAQGAEDLDMVLRRGGPLGRYEPLYHALRASYQLGQRIQGICYNVSNIFGGGNLDDKTPLSRTGHVLVEEIHKLRMLLDVGGHTGEQTSLDAIAMAPEIPVICSHTNMETLVPNVRTTSDRLCEAIARTGGVIGITAVSDFQVRSLENYQQHGPRSPQATLDSHLDQYDYLKNLVGVDHVALGPDFGVGAYTFEHKGEGSLCLTNEVS